MQAFMLYMSGGGVQIFSMGIVFMLLLTPFQNLAGMNDCSSLFSIFVLLFLTLILSYSLCPVCPFQVSTKGVDDIVATKNGVCGMQYVDIGRGFVEVSVNGTFTNGNRRLAGF
jgi:hypothetical protein